MMRISASIVIYKNDPAILSEAVASFLHASPDGLLYLIDNSPTDVCREHFYHPRIKYFFNNRNVGFGAGHNIALRKALRQKSQYHIILNPDVYFDNSVVKTLADFMDANADTGVVMPKVLYPDGRLQHVCKLLPSPLTLFSRRFLTFNQRWLRKLNHWYEMHFSGYDKVMDVPFLSGCFMFLRMDALKKVGLFDERIFLYTEDADLSRRIHKHYRTVFIPNATIYHHHEKASYTSVTQLLHHISSAITYFNKWGWFIDNERDMVNARIRLKLTSD